ncbi:predicted protein [Naegleria gruberi]|uniref:tRNA (adenine(58)-N(1))-methyltransferase n=1 Tax=Naegleria gruberi TaxID=5762 RepID=D2VXA5_NAEGR|nr:uncharacterized protein NAEGRDRAFT_81578 [Naegleria gruberi]EFC38593.1 predicted protein [Naegleria gruberi]|eukprot:XP_002671337.1 predicted protein [Naegleria gruberi strain NEG-M]
MSEPEKKKLKPNDNSAVASSIVSALSSSIAASSTKVNTRNALQKTEDLEQIRKTLLLSLVPSMNDKSDIYNTKQIISLGDKNSNIIREGDLVVFFINHDIMKAEVIKKGHTFDCRFGSFLHENIIGKPFGSKIYSHAEKRPTRRKKEDTTMDNADKKPFVYVLKPTPHLWTLVLKHRTQILYHADISLILTHFKLRPGSVVIEAGTGSGSLSTSISRAIMPNGHLFTFEYHKERYLHAMNEFKNNGLYNITITNGDVCQNGFTPNTTTTPIILSDTLRPKYEPSQILGEDKSGTVDGVFLDLPKPWLCIPNVFRLLRVGGKFCGFSPCIEQIQETANALRQFDFVEIKCVECLVKEYMSNNVEVSTVDHYFKKSDTTTQQTSTTEKRLFSAVPEMKGHTGYLIFATKFQLKE